MCEKDPIYTFIDLNICDCSSFYSSVFAPWWKLTEATDAVILFPQSEGQSRAKASDPPNV